MPFQQLLQHSVSAAGARKPARMVKDIYRASWAYKDQDYTAECEVLGAGFLGHGRDRIKNLHVYSCLALSTHKKRKMLPNYDKGFGFR